MANIDAAFGLRPVGHLDGSPYNGKATMYLVPAADGTAVYVGDLVKKEGTVGAGAAGLTVNGIDCEGMPTVIVAGATDTTLVGVVIGFLPNQSNLETLHRVASTNRIALVSDAPDVVYEIQEDSVGNNIAADQVGNNFDTAYTTGSTVTGRSKVELDSSDSTGTATAQMRLLGMVQKPGNALGDSCKWRVVINEHFFKSTTGA